MQLGSKRPPTDAPDESADEAPSRPVKSPKLGTDEAPQSEHDSPLPKSSDSPDIPSKASAVQIMDLSMKTQKIAVCLTWYFFAVQAIFLNF